MAENTMITIKKPDGTIEKISLADFKARKNKPVAVPASKPATAPVSRVDVPRKMTPPVQKKPFVPNPPAIKSVVPEVVESKPVAPAKPSVKPISTPKAPVQTPISPSIKKIEEKKNIFPAKPTITPSGAPRFVKSDAASLLEEETPPPATVAKPLIKPLGTPMALMKENEDIFPSTSAPVNTFVRAPQKMRAAGQPHPSALPGKERETVSLPVRPIVRDISPAKPSNLGPVEEIEFISLTDFRRLSSSPAEAASRLKQKFINLREESYILFIDGLAAWRQSPLFIEYSGAVTEALNSGKKLSEVLLSDPNKIQMNEVQAIIEMEKDLI